MDYRHLDVFGGIGCLESREKAFEYAPHWHDEYVLALYHGGAKRFRCGAYSGHAAPGDLLVIAPGVLHSAATVGAEGWRYLSLYLSRAQFSEATGIAAAVLEAGFGDALHLTARRDLIARMAAVRDAGSVTELALGEWLLSVFAAAERRPERGTAVPAHLARVRQRILDDPARPTTLSELAHLAGVTPEHLSRAFRRSYGFSPFQMLVAARIERARRLIRSGLSLSEAALEAGFSDQSHMSRWIRRSHGRSAGRLARDQ